jgi:predicted nucleic acid-binding protein
MIANPRIYSDANPIIELAKWAKNAHDPLREPDLQTMERLLKAANNEDISLFTSSVSVAECVAAGDDWDDDVQEFFTGVLTSGRMFKLVQDTIFVTEQARDLRWKHNIRLSGMDAIHVASALEAQCTEFLTWDRGINKSKTQLKAKFLASQGVSVITPSETKLLPPIYLQSKSTLFPL